MEEKEIKSKRGTVLELQPKILGKLPAGEEEKTIKQILVVKYLLVIFGVSSLLGWNVIINASEFYKIRVKGTRFEHSSSHYIQFIGISCTMLGSIANIYANKKVSTRKLILISNIFMSAPLAMLTVLSGVNTDSWPETFFILNLLGLAIMAIAHGIHVSSISALCSMMDPELLKPYYVGKALAGIVATMINLLTISFPGMGTENSALYFFLVATVISMFVITILLWKFVNLDYVKQRIKKKNYATSEQVTDKKQIEKLSNFELLKRIKTQCLACFFQVFLNLAIYPAITLNLEQVNPVHGTRWSDLYYLPVSVILVYNVADFLGKVTSSYLIWPGKNLIWIISLARLILIPMIMMCNIQPRTLPVWFNHDAIPSIIIFFSAFTTGHMLNLSLSYAPTYVEGTENKGRVSIIMFFFLISGGVLASCSVFVVSAVLNS